MIPDILKTRVNGLDNLLRGGLVLPSSGNGLIILIKGQAGTGKTTLALQIACAAYYWQDCAPKKIEVYSYEQDPHDIKKLLSQRLKFENDIIIARTGIKPGDNPYISIEDNPRYPVTAERPIDDKDTTFDWACGLAAKLNEGPEKQKRLVVVDGLNIINPQKRRALEIEELVSVMKKNTLVSIMIFEHSQFETGGIDSLADMVFELHGKEYEGPPNYYLNRIAIGKSRFQQSILGWHQYKIRETGVTIFPSLHYHTSRINYLENRLKDSQIPLADLKIEEDRGNCGDDKSVLTKLIGTDYLKQGSCTVVLGSRRTWKTQLTLDFLRAGSCIEQPGLLVSLLGNQGTIVEQRSCLCKQYCIGEGCPEYKKCYKQVYLFHFRPGCLAPGEFLHYLERRLNMQAKNQSGLIKRLVFWDLTQLESRFPLLASDHMFLAGLMDYLKNSEYGEDTIHQTNGDLAERKSKKRLITSVFMGAPNMKLAQAASAMADNVVFCWQDAHRDLGDGVAFYVDRIEGHPGGKKLAFLNMKKEEEKVTDINEILQLDCREKDLPYAESMIEEIRNLQGLPSRRRYSK